MTTIPLPRGHILDVTGSHGASARVSPSYGNVQTHTFNGATPDTVSYGPFVRDIAFAIEVIAGSPTWRTRDLLTKAVQEGTDRIRAATTIAKALNEGKQAMALVDKFKTIAARSHAIPKNLEARADALAARLDSVEQRGEQAFKGHEDFLAGVESGVAAAEDALNQLTNGAPAT